MSSLGDLTHREALRTGSYIPPCTTSVPQDVVRSCYSSATDPSGASQTVGEKLKLLEYSTRPHSVYHPSSPHYLSGFKGHLVSENFSEDPMFKLSSSGSLYLHSLLYISPKYPMTCYVFTDFLVCREGSPN